MAIQLRTPEEKLNYAEAFIQVDMKPLDLDFWQMDYIKDTDPYSITTKSRRTGFSFTVAMKGLVKAMDPARFKYVRQFVSYNEDDAKEKINYAKEFYHSIPTKYKKPLVSETKTTMEFYDTRKKTTSRLISIACRPPRGKGGDIVFDEFAIYPKNKADIIYTAGLPVVARGGAVEIGSTPLGMIGRFYEILTDEILYPKYARLTIPWWFANALCNDVPDAVKRAKDMETEERVMKYGSPHVKDQFMSMLLEDFQQEYECTFIDSALSYITLELIWANTPGMREGDRDKSLIGGDIDDKDIQPEEEIEVKVFKDVDSLLTGYSTLFEKYSNGEPIRLYLGYDVARRRDAAVVFLIGKLPSGKKLSIAEIEMKNTKFEDQLDVVRKIMHNLPVIRAAMDMTGMGEPLCERLQTEFTAAKVEGILFNAENKEILALGVRTGLENLEFLLQNDSRFHKQIHSIKRFPTGVGRFRYDSERDQDGHADSFWAWALANYAVVELKETRQGFYQQIKARRETSANIETKTAGLEKPVKARGKSLNSLLRSWDKRGG
jgi:phage FluMu gp28-like protein